MVREILKLGNPGLYEISEEITEEEYPLVKEWAQDLHDTLMDYRKTYGAGRAIAAPQIGIKKRMIYMYTDKAYVIVNPVMAILDEEMTEVTDDCMSFPGLLVKVMRYNKVRIGYTDENGEMQVMDLEGDLSELLQHEYDHLHGILATMRAKDNKSFIMAYMKRDF